MAGIHDEMKDKERRLYPSLRHHSYLVLARRRELLCDEVARLQRLGRNDLLLLDVGGQDKPYAPLFGPITRGHFVMEPLSGSVDVVAVGESIPFVDESFDIVLCTQVLEHVSRPSDVVMEIHRVLRPGGAAFVSVPAVFPIHGAPADNWRFMPGGLRLLLNPFHDVRVMAEAGTVAGFFRTLNMYAWLLTGRRWARPLRWLARNMVFPVSNLLGFYLDRWLKSGDQFAVNWLAVARK